MKKIRNFLSVLVILIFCSCLFACAIGDSGANMKGKPAPDFTVTDAEGNKVKLSDFAGKKVVINFWASYCPPCRGELPSFNKAYLESDPEKVVFLMISLDDNSARNDAIKLVNSGGYKFPIYFDTDRELIKTYQITNIPRTYIVDESGIITYFTIGQISYEELNLNLK